MSTADIAVVMGSKSDWETMKGAVEVLGEFGISHGAAIVSAHRTPERMNQFAKNAHKHGVKVIIAGAGGAAHLPGMIAAQTTIPVLGVPVKSSALSGLDSLFSIVQMPRGVPVATFSIGEAGAQNAAIFAISMLALGDAELADKLTTYKAKLAETAIDPKLPAVEFALAEWL